MTKQCLNHPHYACYCREERFANLMTAVDHLVRHKFDVEHCITCKKSSEDLARANEEEKAVKTR